MEPSLLKRYEKISTWRGAVLWLYGVVVEARGIRYVLIIISINHSVIEVGRIRFVLLITSFIHCEVVVQARRIRYV